MSTFQSLSNLIGLWGSNRPIGQPSTLCGIRQFWYRVSIERERERGGDKPDIKTVTGIRTASLVKQELNRARLISHPQFL
jgi:hypothetical protein